MSRKDDIKKLILNHNRRLQILREQKAIEGRSVDPKILIEIEDIVAEIDSLQAELKEIDRVKSKRDQPIRIWLNTDNKDVRIGLSYPTDKLTVNHALIKAFGQIKGLTVEKEYLIGGFIITDIEYEQGAGTVDKDGYWEIDAIHLGARTHRLFFRIFDATDQVIAKSKEIKIFKR
jgi:hypothetical protein